MKKLTLILLSVLFLFASNASATIIYDVQKELADYGNLDQDDIPGIGGCACGPTAAINSFVYLENHYSNYFGGRNSIIPDQDLDLDNDGDSDYYDDMIAAGQTIGNANYMNTKCNAPSGLNGTWDDMMIYGKYQFLEDNTDKEIIYNAQLSSTWGWPGTRPLDEIPPIPKPDWVQNNTNPTWGFLYEQLEACEDVEILINWEYEEGGHYLTLTSFHFEDADEDGFIDQDEYAYIDYIDPCNGNNRQSPVYELSGLICGDYFGTAFTVTMAVSESVPEPVTLILLGFGSLLLRRRKA